MRDFNLTASLEQVITILRYTPNLALEISTPSPVLGTPTEPPPTKIFKRAENLVIEQDGRSVEISDLDTSSPLVFSLLGPGRTIRLVPKEEDKASLVGIFEENSEKRQAKAEVTQASKALSEIPESQRSAALAKATEKIDDKTK